MSKKNPHIVQYQGSKRILASQILQYMPNQFNRLIEPFSGMAAISIAVAKENRTRHFYINDLNHVLVNMLQEAIESPSKLIKAYEDLWWQQFSFTDGHVQHYYKVRNDFNSGEETSANMLYLLARCVKGAVRYGRNGKFNQSPDKRRHGTAPQTLANNIHAVSALLKGKCVFSALDYHEVLNMAQPGDLVYMDPPYQGVSDTRDNRYFAGVPFDEFVVAIEKLDSKGINFLISYDGECGGKEYGEELPVHLGCKKIMLNAGLSSQALLLGKKSTTFEALYISKNLSNFFNPQFELFPMEAMI